MKIKFRNVSLFKKSIDLISGLINEGTFITKKSFLELTALNPNNVVFVNFQMLQANFEEYDITEDEQVTLNIASLNEILKRIDNSATVALETKDATLIVSVSGKHNKTFTLSLIDYVNENLNKLPSFDFASKMTLRSSDFTEAISDLEIVTDVVDFELDTKNKIFDIQGRSHDKKGSFTFTDDVNIELLKEPSRDVLVSKYSLEYLKKFTKGEKISEFVSVYLDHDMPLKVDYKVVDEVLVSFILASRGE